jgi:hypothetical protein
MSEPTKRRRDRRSTDEREPVRDGVPAESDRRGLSDADVLTQIDADVLTQIIATCYRREADAAAWSP